MQQATTGTRQDRAAPTWFGAAAALFAVGWGANQFSSLLLSYRLHARLGVSTVDALFGVYALGLIPALLVGGPLSDRHGRRLVVPVVAGSAVATGVLMLGSTVGLTALYAGRFLAGVVSGLAFAPGTAWVKELSSSGGGDDQVGARRAAIALSAGFGAGPLVAGLIAQWAPHPAVTPYLAHLAIVAGVAIPVLRTPETVRGLGAGAAGGARRETQAPLASRADRRFGRAVAPMAPWVFAAASVSFAVLPAQVTRRTGGFEVAFAAVVAGLTLLAGVVVQPWARRLELRRTGAAARGGLATVAAGMAVGALACSSGQPSLVLVAALALGAGYGTCLVAGLLAVGRLAPAGGLARLTATFYALTYIGFAAPLVLSAAASVVSYPRLLVLCAVLAAATSVGIRPEGPASG